MSRSRFLPAAIALALLVAPSACDRPADDLRPFIRVKTDPQSIADGRKIAETQCSNCHALDNDPKMRAEDPPPLRYVLAQYSPDALAENFRDGIHVGHEMMPEFVFGPLGTDVLLAYIVSIQREPPTPE